MILTQNQAEAVTRLRAAGCKTLDLVFDHAVVKADRHGAVLVSAPRAEDEEYADQAAFAAAYNLNA